MTDDAQPLKILQVASHDSIRRGGAVQVYRLARELVRRGHTVTCVFHAKGGKPAESDAETIAKVEESGARLLYYDMESWCALWRFRRFLVQERFDVIHSHRDPALRFATLATLFGSRPGAFLTNRGTTYRLKPRKMSYWLFRRRALDRVVAVAHAVKQALMDSGGLAPEKIDVIYGSVDVERFAPGCVDREEARRRFGIPADAFVVGTVASWAPKKGYDVFFRAAREMRARWGETGRTEPIHLLAAGGRVDKKEGALIDELGLRDIAALPGHCEDVPAALAAMDVFVCASTKGEGLTGTIREALAMGVPVISSDVSGNGEIVRPGETGLLVPPGDAEALAEAVLRMARDAEGARAMAEVGRRLVLTEFTDEVRGERIECLYRSILAARRR